jgi:hypothetical protein
MATRHAPPNEHRAGFPAVNDIPGATGQRWDAASHAMGPRGKGRMDKLRENRARRLSGSAERRGSLNPPPPAGPPPPSHTQAPANTQLHSESSHGDPRRANGQQRQAHPSPPLPHARRNSMTNQSTFEALVQASDFAVPRSEIKDLHEKFQELETSLKSRGLVVPPSNLLRNLITSTNESGATSFRLKRRQSDAGVTTGTAPAPPPYQDLLHKKPAALPPPPNGLQRDPSARSLAKVKERVGRVNPPPHQLNPSSRSASGSSLRSGVAPPGGMTRSGSNRSTLSDKPAALIARGNSKGGSDAPAKFKDKLYSVLEARNRENLLQYKKTVAELKGQLESMESKLNDRNELLRSQQDQLTEVEARANATEARLEQQLTEAIAMNEQLQALQLTVEQKDWEYKESTRRARMRFDASVDTLRSLLAHSPPPKLPEVLQVLKARATSMVRAGAADIYVLDRRNSELISFRARVKVSIPTTRYMNIRV